MAQEKVLAVIYSIRNIINNFQYIGSTNNFKRRKREHMNALKNQKSSKKLQNAFNKYGEEKFIFEILYLFPENYKNEELLLKEQQFINKNLLSYNTRDEAKSNRGLMLSEEHKKKIGIANKGRKLSENHKELLSKAHFGTKRGPMNKIIKEKIAQSNKNKIVSEETKLKLSILNSGENHPNYGKKKIKCPKGHFYKDENLHIDSKGRRFCLLCRSERNKNLKEKRKIKNDRKK